MKEVPEERNSRVGIVDGRHVGRIVVEEGSMFQCGVNVHETAFAQRLQKDERTRRSVVFCLNNNSPNSYQKEYAIERGASAYFTWNPQSRSLIIEWGEIDGNKAKLHDYLNKIIDYPARNKKGMTIRSGHMAKVRPEGIMVCLLDSTFMASEMVRVLNGSGFLVLDGEGQIQKPKEVMKMLAEIKRDDIPYWYKGPGAEGPISVERVLNEVPMSDLIISVKADNDNGIKADKETVMVMNA